MHYQFVSYLWVSLVLLLILLTLFVFSWKRRSMRCVPALLSILLTVAVWIVAQALEMAAVDLPTKIFWANIQYTPILLSPMFYFYMAVHFTDRSRWLAGKWLPLLLLVMPAACNILLWTNDFHHLMRQNIYLDLNGPFPVVAKTYGPLFWVFSVYNFSISLFALFLMLRGLRKKNRQQRAQVFTVFLGLLLPMCSTMLYISKIIVSRIDFTPIFIGVSALIIFGGIFRYRLFDIVPIAHSMIIREMNTGMILFDNEGSILEINPAARSLLGLPQKQSPALRADFLSREFPQLFQIYEKQASAVEEAVLQNGDNKRCCEVSLKPLAPSPSVSLGWIMQIYDITARKQEEERIRLAASHDALTGLVNRVYFKKLFAEKFSAAKASGSALALAYMDLDDFKQINDRYGHDAGDAYLCGVADRLKSVLYESDIIARYGGDEYVILFSSLGDQGGLEKILQKTERAFESPIEYNGMSLPIRASMGFGVYPQDGGSLDSLIKKADKAMYEVKDSKRASRS